jgi:hypothetical protein
MQWEKVKPKGGCQCHASSDGEGQNPNYLFHGVTLFWLCCNGQKRAKKSVIAITFWSFSERNLELFRKKKGHPTLGGLVKEGKTPCPPSQRRGS